LRKSYKFLDLSSPTALPLWVGTERLRQAANWMEGCGKKHPKALKFISAI
jgi:hypothetical protein